MMRTETADNPGHADDIVPVTTYEASLPESKNKFLPWHLPRKQFVREHQWRDQISRMLDASPLVDGTLKYLGLPGIDLLDLRYFHTHVCEARDISLRFLGFNKAAQPASQAQIELNISLDEVRRLPRVDQISDVIGDDFVRVANVNSIAWKKACAFGPYNVINLDLCDGFGSHSPDDAITFTHYNALNQLLSLQARSISPWLLLLTTRAGPEHVNSDVLERLIVKYVSNLATCRPFREKSQEHFKIEDEAALRVAATTAAGMLPVFLCGLSKWIVGIALGHQPPTKVEVKSVVGYRVDSNAEYEDLISLALRFTPTMEPVGDPVGLAKPSISKLDECTLSVNALNRIASRKDADRILSENPTLNGAMIDAAAGLLELARYDPVAYRLWAASLPVHLP
jgi:hypothetical protein